MSESKTPYKNDYGIVVRGYESRLGGLYKSEDVALRAGKETDPVHALVRFADVVALASAESDLAASRAEVERLRDLAHDLDGVIIDVTHGGFDDVCLQTVTRVRDALAAKEPHP